MSRWKYTAVDKLKEGEEMQLFGFIAIPEVLRFKKKPMPDVHGYVEAVDKAEAREMANRQIKRLWPHCRIQDIYEDKK